MSCSMEPCYSALDDLMLNYWSILHAALVDDLKKNALPLLEVLPVFSVLCLSSSVRADVRLLEPWVNPAEGGWLLAGGTLWTRFPSLPALISLSPIRSMHDRFPCSSFLMLGLLDPADPGRLRRGEDFDIFPAGLSRVLLRYSRVSLVALLAPLTSSNRVSVSSCCSWISLIPLSLLFRPPSSLHPWCHWTRELSLC